jgi:hypothetical protein
MLPKLATSLSSDKEIYAIHMQHATSQIKMTTLGAAA